MRRRTIDGVAAAFRADVSKMVDMCRSIKVLRRPQEPATRAEIAAALLQFVRKISGYPKPSKANQEAFERAVMEISGASERLLQSIGAI